MSIKNITDENKTAWKVKMTVRWLAYEEKNKSSYLTAVFVEKQHFWFNQTKY